MVYFIWKSGFGDLVFLILRHSPISEIFKTIIFIDQIKIAIELKKYLWSRFSDYARNENQAFGIIQSLTSNLNANIRTKVMKDL